MARGAWGGDHFKYFRPRGAIIRGRRLIEGRLFFEEIRYTSYSQGKAEWKSSFGV